MLRQTKEATTKSRLLRDHLCVNHRESMHVEPTSGRLRSHVQ